MAGFKIIRGMMNDTITVQFLKQGAAETGNKPTLLFSQTFTEKGFIALIEKGKEEIDAMARDKFLRSASAATPTDNDDDEIDELEEKDLGI